MITKELAKALRLPSVAISITVSIWMIGTYPVKDGLTAIQVFHNHAEKYIKHNREAATLVMDEVRTRDNVKSYEFQRYVLEGLILRTIESKRMTENEKKSQLKRYEFELDEVNDSLRKTNQKLDKISETWPIYQVAIRYKAES